MCAGVAVLAVFAALALPSARRRHEQAVAAGVDDLPPEPVELHLRAGTSKQLADSRLTPAGRVH
ncbi:hypothetical protein, partial [Micromonospora sp. M51]|uniref:hypothetical protein n=1 Tax=Micromonospora sp. M51 TaxID=2824889 RepID=UPI001FFC8764